VKRRQFFTLLSGAAVAPSVSWPLAARAQQPKMPVIGLLQSASARESVDRLGAFHQGLRDGGYVEGQNVAIEYRWADNQYERLPGLAADLARRQVAVIVAGGGGLAPQAAKTAMATIPIVFSGGFDPVESGLVASLNRPGGNVTGVTFFANVLEAKRLGLLHELVPRAPRIGVLLNPGNASAQRQSKDLKEAARGLGVDLQLANASSERELEPAFAGLLQQGAGALLVAGDAVFTNRKDSLIALAARYAIPAIYSGRDFIEAGGLVSYGTSITYAYRQIGVYAGRILKGAKPADLPVLQPTKFELVINLKTAKALGLNVPPALLALADEVIE